MSMLFYLFFRVAALPHGQTLNYDAYLTIMIMALGVMVAVFAIFVGLAAVWGYTGLKDVVRDMASREVKESISLTLKEYPSGGEIVELFQSLKTKADALDVLQNLLVTPLSAKTLEKASKPGIKEAVASVAPPESTEQQASGIESYPGEEQANVPSGNGTTVGKNGSPDTGTGDSETPKDGPR